jgi:two-component sensor histidine kinase
VITFCAGAELTLLGLDEYALAGTNLSDHYEAAYYQAELLPMYARAWAGEQVSFPLSYQGIDYEVTAVPMHGPDGEVSQVLGVTVNTTERRLSERRQAQSLREKEMLLAEIHHRVKNNLAIVAGLLRLQMPSAVHAETRDILDESCARIDAMALIHENLYKSEDFSQVAFHDYVENLTISLGRAYARQSTEISMETKLIPLGLDILRSVPCGLIVNELVTNAYKHAFQGRATGKIEVSLECSSEGMITLAVCDDGRGLPPGFDILAPQQSLGLNLVQGLALQIGAVLTVKTSAKGSTFELSFPLEDASE